MSKQEIFKKLRQQSTAVEPGQEFAVRRIEEEDAWGVARCFLAVYGEEFPFDFYYVPEKLLEENRRKQVYSVVARTESGETIGHGALYRSSAYYPRVYELGQYAILPDYQSGSAAFALQEFLLDTVVPSEEVEELFAETSCHNVSRQKMAAYGKFLETALEVGLMPPEAYPSEDFPDERISCLLQFRRVRDVLHQVYIPEDYAQALSYILSGLDISRSRAIADAPIPPGSTTRLLSQFFDFAQVGRFNVQALGEDFDALLETAEIQAMNRGIVVFQAFVNLGEPWCGQAVRRLRQKGYFLGGFLPRWFDTDGLLMQKISCLPQLDNIRLYSDRAHRILDFIRSEIEANPLCRPEPTSAEQFLDKGEPEIRRPMASADLKVVVSGSGMTIEEVVSVAKYGAAVSLTKDPAVLERMRSSAAFIQWGARTGEPIYGVNTGFGGMANVAIGEKELSELQANLIRFLKAGAGGYLPREEVRAAMLLRANSHAKGVSGVREELITRLLAFLNHNVTPMVREFGSIGASGDLIPLATITGAITGADAAFEVDFQGERMDCLNALGKLGFDRFQLGPKEGLGMVNGTSFMAGIAANCLYEGRNLLALALGFHALVFHSLAASNQSFHPFIHQVKPHPGQVLTSKLMLRLLKGSRMCRNELDGHHDFMGGQPAQDRYSLRCLPQYLGPIVDGLRNAAEAVETEMNSASDNPLIDGKNSVSYHSGNFLGQYIGVWMDHFRYYLGLLAKHMDSQIALLVAPEFNGGLPASLVGNRERRVNMGLKGLQICGNALMPLLSFYGNSIADRFPSHAEQFNQNINSQGYNAALLARQSVVLLRQYIALSLIFGVQAVDLRASLHSRSYDPRKALAPAILPLYEGVKAVLGVPTSETRPLIQDDDQQSLDLYVELLANSIAAEGALVTAVNPIANLLY